MQASKLFVFDGASWVNIFDETAVATLGVNAFADETKPPAVSSPGSLFDHEGGDHRIYVNKQTSADTASIIFQTAYTGKAEFGLAGNSALSFKVADGSGTWRAAVTINSDTAHVGMGALPIPRLHFMLVEICASVATARSLPFMTPAIWCAAATFRFTRTMVTILNASWPSQ